MEAPRGKSWARKSFAFLKTAILPLGNSRLRVLPQRRTANTHKKPLHTRRGELSPGLSPLTVLADLPLIMFGGSNPAETRPANPKRQLEWTTPVRDQLHKIERRLESLDLHTSNEVVSRQAMTELVQAVQVLTGQIHAFAETSVDQSRKIRIGLDQNRAGLESLFNAVNQQTHTY